MKKITISVTMLLSFLLTQMVFANQYDQMKFEIDFEQSPEFSKKLAQNNQIDLKQFMSMGDLKRNQLAQQYFESQKIIQNRPKLNFEKNCENRITFDDYRIETGMRYGFSMRQAVNASGYYLPFNVCEKW